MFSRRSHGDVKKSTQKVLDPKKDVLTRLKHLRALLDNVDASDLKQFFETNYSQIYFIFYENFITLENSLKLKGKNNSLQTNCAEEQVLIFACLVPGFPAIMSSRGPCTLETLLSPSPGVADAKVYPEEITPLVPAVSGEKIAEDQTCFFLQLLLKYMVIQAASLEWKHKENQETGFKFLFTLFRKYYLPHLFPSFTKLTNIYKPVLDVPHLRPKPVYITTTRDNENIYSTKIPYMAARVVFIKWIVTFFLEKKYLSTAQNTKNGVDVLPKIIQTVGGGAAVQDRAPELDSGAAEPDRSHSNSSTLSDRRLSSSSLCSVEEEHRAVYEMVQRILLSTRGYVNFVNEVFRQAFLLPSCDIAVTRKVVQVYRKWILQEKPVFMEEPDIKEVAQEDAEKLGFSETDAKETSSESSGHKRSSSWGRTYSFTSAVSRGCVTEEENQNVKAGAQAMLQVFLTNAANVFLLEPCAEVPMLLKEQVDACKAVLIIFRRMIMELTMNKKTWEQMLQILLRITEAVMQKPKDKQVKDLFAQSLAGLLFRTLMVAWIRANLCVPISRELWDDFLGVLSSRTEWEELINEWASIMDSLTAVLARTVYGVEMTNLPLDKLSEQKEKKQRGKGCVPDSQKGTTVGRSFSLSWRSHPEMTEPMRFRSATTSGAPGVEKARNIVRQKATEVEECPQQESAPAAEPGAQAADEQQRMVRSSSSPDVTEPLGADAPPGTRSLMCGSNLPPSPGTSICRRCGRTKKKKIFFPVLPPEIFVLLIFPSKPPGPNVGDTQSVSSSEPRPVQESKGHTKKEHEGITISVRRSSSPAELDLKDDLPQTQGKCRERQKSDSVGSDTGLGYGTDTELSLSPWQTYEEDPDLNTPTDAVTDSDARHWLQLSPTDASHVTDSSECLADDCSIIAGGTLTGWHPDSAAVLWRRVLGILGDVNNIQSPKIHARVFGYLYELWYKLAKIRDNLAISLDNQSSPSPPALIPPLRMFASWLFKATTLPNEYKEGKLQAYKLICAMMTRRQDVLPNSDFLVHFYLVMHLGLTSEDQDILNTIVRHCPPRFFSLGLPGFSMLMGDFITAAARVLSADMLAAPRSEALTILGSLVCFPNTYREVPLLQSLPDVTEVVTGTDDVKHYLISILLKNATEEPNEHARCIAICSLGVWICEELAQCMSHPQLKEAVNVIGVTLKFPNKVVAQVACDVLQLLVSYWEKLQIFEPSLPRKIAEILVATIAFLLPSAEYSSVETDKKVSSPSADCFLPWALSSQTFHLSFAACDAVCLHHHAFIWDDKHALKASPPPHRCADSLGLCPLLAERRRRSLELIPLTARMVMAHLVNHLGHFPLCGGPAALHSLVSENHDNAHADAAELSPEVFRSPNLQLFVFNDSTLISCLQTPAQGPADGSPAGALSDVRVIVRDISGKYSWDGKVLYGPLAGCPAPQGRCPSSLVSGWPRPPSGPQKDLSQTDEGEDVLDKLLENIGHTSPECLLPSQLNLNEPSPPPCGMSRDQEKEIIQAILRQSAQEDAYVQRCHSDPALRVASQEQPFPVEPRGAFYFCRLLLDDLGMNSWDRRKNFHLLKKNSKLLRELKHLDSRQCRETHKIAVFYIAEGQEDKCSILSNERGSQAYEDFVAGLGWEVMHVVQRLHTHTHTHSLSLSLSPHIPSVSENSEELKWRSAHLK
uniref:Rap-GAP domain-containing protein n=1 Tax=Sus scrofa TaxID=9823 RepID=A0A8D1KHG3_PIG